MNKKKLNHTKNHQKTQTIKTMIAKKTSQNSYLTIFKKITKYTFGLLSVCAPTALILKSISFVFATSCVVDNDNQWMYKIALRNGKTFDKMPFLCRVFKRSCDPNHPNLNKIEKNAMKIFNEEGKEGDYMELIYEHKSYYNDFFEGWFCNTGTKFDEKIFTFHDMYICPRILRCQQPEWTQKCQSAKDIDPNECNTHCNFYVDALCEPHVPKIG